MIYITGDTHGDFSRFEYFCRENNTSKEEAIENKWREFLGVVK